MTGFVAGSSMFSMIDFVSLSAAMLRFPGFPDGK